MRRRDSAENPGCPLCLIMNLSGRGDKDVAQVAAKVKLEMPK
jgi:tryptophan synthase beta subunit